MSYIRFGYKVKVPESQNPKGCEIRFSVELVFGMTQPGIKPTTYQSQVGHRTTRPLNWYT